MLHLHRDIIQSWTKKKGVNVVKIAEIGLVNLIIKITLEKLFDIGGGVDM